MLVRRRSLRQLVCGTCPLGCLRPPGTPGHSLIRCSQPCESTCAAGPRGSLVALGRGGCSQGREVLSPICCQGVGAWQLESPGGGATYTSLGDFWPRQRARRGCVSGSCHLAVVQDTTHYHAPWVQGSKLASGLWRGTVGIPTLDELVLAQVLGGD